MTEEIVRFCLVFGCFLLSGILLLVAHVSDQLTKLLAYSEARNRKPKDIAKVIV